MPNFSDMLTYLRKRSNMTQAELATATGIGRGAISMYESGKREPAFEIAEVFADYFNVNMDTLMGRTSGDNPPFRIKTVPRLGSIACGDPILAEQNIEGYDSVPDWVHCDFTLVCKGDSMTGARIYDGDVVCIRQQEEVESGQIAAVLVDDETESGSATLKRVRIVDGGIILMPENPNYEPQFYLGADASRVHILGLATHFISAIR